MPPNLALRLSTVSHTLFSRNRKVRAQEGRLGQIMVRGLILATAGVIFISVLWAYSNLRSTALNYEISRARETQKQHLELNRMLRVELSHLTSISRLENLALTYDMGPPTPGQVVNLR